MFSPQQNRYWQNVKVLYCWRGWSGDGLKKNLNSNFDVGGGADRIVPESKKDNLHFAGGCGWYTSVDFPSLNAHKISEKKFTSIKICMDG